MTKILIPLVLLASTLLAQSTGTATLVGNVTDPTGATVAGAKVTVLNTGSGFLSESTTKADGSYSFPI